MTTEVEAKDELIKNPLVTIRQMQSDNWQHQLVLPHVKEVPSEISFPRHSCVQCFPRNKGTRPYKSA